MSRTPVSTRTVAPGVFVQVRSGPIELAPFDRTVPLLSTLPVPLRMASPSQAVPSTSRVPSTVVSLRTATEPVWIVAERPAGTTAGSPAAGTKPYNQFAGSPHDASRPVPMNVLTVDSVIALAPTVAVAAPRSNSSNRAPEQSPHRMMSIGLGPLYGATSRRQGLIGVDRRRTARIRATPVTSSEPKLELPTTSMSITLLGRRITSPANAAVASAPTRITPRGSKFVRLDVERAGLDVEHAGAAGVHPHRVVQRHDAVGGDRAGC